jgi:hypothetical protein
MFRAADNRPACFPKLNSMAVGGTLMQCVTNFGSVLKSKARIYVWLLIGLVPAWIYGLTACFAQPDPARQELLLSITSLSLIASLWIVILQWEVVEQRRIPRRVRTLLLGLSFFVGFLVSGTFVRWSTGSIQGMYLPIILSAAPLSALLAIVRMGAIAAGSVSAPGSALSILGPLDVFVLLFCLPVVWGAMIALASSPHTRSKTRLFLGTIVSHYLVGVLAIVLMTAEDRLCLGDIWHQAPWFLTGWALAYAGAHVLLWRSFLRNRTRKTVPPQVAVLPEEQDKADCVAAVAQEW